MDRDVAAWLHGRLDVGFGAGRRCAGKGRGDEREIPETHATLSGQRHWHGARGRGKIADGGGLANRA
jgi:hypothetical protein